MRKFCFVIVLVYSNILFPLFSSVVEVGLDRVFSEDKYRKMLQGKRIGLISHHAAINRERKDALKVFEEQGTCTVKVLMSPEHGFYGAFFAETLGKDQSETIKKYKHISLYGKSEIPSSIVDLCDVLVFDVQDIGVRSYSFIQVLLKAVRASEKYKIPLIILDRPNPLGGNLVDGPLPTKGFVPDVPYCHGMTSGELAKFFQSKYSPESNVIVVPMVGWHRSMTFRDTGLLWIPTSPQIPEDRSPFFYATTGILGHLSLTSIGVGYTLPFQVVGAPWIEEEVFAKTLNSQNLPGVFFFPYQYEPFFGKFKMELCKGIFLVITDSEKFLPLETQFTILGVLKRLYPKKFVEAIEIFNQIPYRKTALSNLLGREDVFEILERETYIMWPLRKLSASGKKQFLVMREPFLLPEYVN
ncbi:exo-beta-N-acetylmuramidase NamZ family protein [Chlamydiifrater volucris]|uniref:exo-beta-N-acetylmuramidase NamZ family protein n=1 Tax=Chlamydiifrater volucris TaxID=2681470 RepID=UPI001BCD5D1E|nr:exo-beta-N-acetylmuramidase NamZ domain-containing protein [Chlamydiifrater volucris]